MREAWRNRPLVLASSVRWHVYQEHRRDAQRFDAMIVWLARRGKYLVVGRGS